MFVLQLFLFFFPLFLFFFFFFNDTATTEIYTLSLHDALPISTSSPQVSPNSASHLRTPQYRTRETSTWSPGSRDWKTAVAAAIPEANSAQAQPAPSRAASSRSACSEV